MAPPRHLAFPVDLPVSRASRGRLVKHNNIINKARYLAIFYSFFFKFAKVHTSGGKTAPPPSSVFQNSGSIEILS